MMFNSEEKKMFGTFGLIMFAFIASWLINTVDFIQTVVADDFVWSEIGAFTIVQGCAILLWPVTIITGPISLFV